MNQENKYRIYKMNVTCPIHGNQFPSQLKCECDMPPPIETDGGEGMSLEELDQKLCFDWFYPMDGSERMWVRSVDKSVAIKVHEMLSLLQSQVLERVEKEREVNNSDREAICFNQGLDKAKEIIKQVFKL